MSLTSEHTEVPVPARPPWCLACYNMDADCPEDGYWDRRVGLRFNLAMGPEGLWLRGIPIEVFRHPNLFCRFCKILSSVISKLPLGQKPRKRSGHFTELMFFRPPLTVENCVDRIFITLESGKAPKLLLGGLNEEVELYTPQGCTPPWDHLPILPEISCSPSSDQAIRFIKTCLEACTKGTEHLDCQETKNTQALRQLPKRLVEIREDGARLIDTKRNELPETTNYVALSYCWGPPPFLRTLQENIDQFLSPKGFQGSKMPQVLTEAMDVTRRLGFCFIWIDCLCIVQDDTADWAHEAAKMGAIYEDAQLTLAITGSPGVNFSFLQQNEWYGLNHRLTITNEDGGPAILAMRHCHRSGIHRSRNMLEEPWKTRAWTYQEQLLSKRLVMFTPSELQWVCCSVQKCECQSTERLDGTSLFLKLSKENAFQLWRETVEEYSSRKLTKPDDKLPAISGVAQRLFTALQPRKMHYVAGLWDDGASNLVHDLAWRLHSEPTRECSQSTGAWRAPSFSWAALDDRVTWPSRFRPYEHIKFEVVAESKKEDAPFGEVKSVSLKLTGPLLLCDIAFADDETEDFGRYEVFTVPERGMSFYHDGPFDIDPSAVVDGDIPLDGTHHCCTKCSATYLNSALRRASLFYLGDTMDKDTGGRLQQIFLVLAQISPSAYKRIGLLPVEYPDNHPDKAGGVSLEGVLKMFNKSISSRRIAQAISSEEKKSNQRDNENGDKGDTKGGRRQEEEEEEEEEEEDDDDDDDSVLSEDACLLTWDETNIQTITLV